MRRFPPAICLASITLALAAGWPVTLAKAPQAQAQQFPSRPAQQPAPPTFRTRVDLVQVDVIATGADGRFVNTLKQEDFELFEDDKPQRVALFQVVDVPIRGQAASSLAFTLPDVRNNATGTTGRVYLIVLDDVRTPFDQSGYGRAAATRFVQQYMEPGDTGAIVFASGRRGASQEFTSDRRLLLASIDNFVGRVTPVESTVNEATAHTVRTIVTTLAALAQSLGAQPTGGRKACVYVGPGFPLEQADGTRPITSGEYHDLVGAANRANVTFYTIDPAGLTTLAEGARADVAGVDAVSVEDDLRASHEGLRWLAADTGGFGVADSNNFDRPFERIRRETSSYYLLGYYPEPQKEGTTHRIAVRVRRPGITVRARNTYAVPKASTRVSTALRAKNVPVALLPALDSPLSETGIRFSAAAAVFHGTARAARWASVVIEIDGRDLDTNGKGGADVAVVAIDATGAVRGHEVRHIDLTLDPAALTRVRDAGLRVHARVPLEGDVRAMRIAVADSATPRVGSLSIDLDVPDFDRDEMSMGGLLLTDSCAQQVPTTNADEEFRKILGAPASTRREFQVGEAISWTTEIYQRPGTARDVQVTTLIEGSDRRPVFRREEQHPLTERRNARGGIQVAGQARLTSLPPGSYVLRVEAAAAGAKNPIVREVPFAVRN